MAYQININIDGRAYPFRQTMGAALLFTKVTGREISVLEEGRVTDMVAWLWAGVKSGCRREGIEFDMTLDEFADRLDAEDVAEWMAQVTEGQKAKSTDEKKSE